MKKQLEDKSFLQPTEYFTDRFLLENQQTYSFEELKNMLTELGFRERNENQKILEEDFIVLNPEGCLKGLAANGEPLFLPETTIGSCILFRTPLNDFYSNELSWIVFNADNSSILQLFTGEARVTKAPHLSFGTQVIAQYLGAEPIMQETVDLGQMPPMCLQAVIAIEDKNFLEHQGFSFWNMLRAGVASVRNLAQGRRVQGGSTITQQLVKNYFLTHERTLKRKYQEILLSVALEDQLTKDEILNLYLNIIYMGQNGPFQVRGFGAASKFYYQKSISDLNLQECAFLAAVLNGPGVYDPYKRADRAKLRRDVVLARMAELTMISENDKKAAQESPLIVGKSIEAFETAPYFLGAVRAQLQGLEIDPANKKILTTLDLNQQRAAQNSMNTLLTQLEKNHKKIKTLGESGKRLEAVIMSTTNDGRVSTLIGGRSFRTTQFNRALSAHRQAGSIFKPFVYLRALETGDYDPATLISDDPVTIDLQNRKWTPSNYDKKFHGQIPFYVGLEKSLNVATVNVLMAVGIDEVIDLAKRYQITSPMLAVPSLALGAFELYPYEVLRTYSGFANFGRVPELTYVRKVLSSELETVYESEPRYVEGSQEGPTATLVSMMKLIPLRGTARSIQASGFAWPSAGKTGTTNDYKDSWYAGFTPKRTTLTWVGYDDNSISGLTGSNGAVPLWTSFMKQAAAKDPILDFPWPESLEKREMTEDEETFTLHY